MTLVAFAEGKVMIEAQQKVMGATPRHRVMRTGVGGAVTLPSATIFPLARNECRVEMETREAVVSPHKLAGAQA